MRRWQYFLALRISRCSARQRGTECPGTADPTPTAERAAPEPPVAALGSTAVLGNGMDRGRVTLSLEPPQQPFRKWRGVTTPIRTAPPDTVTNPSYACLSTEIRSLSFSPKSICSSPGPEFAVSLTTEHGSERGHISTALKGDISTAVRHGNLCVPVCPPLCPCFGGQHIYVPGELDARIEMILQPGFYFVGAFGNPILQDPFGPYSISVH